MLDLGLETEMHILKISPGIAERSQSNVLLMLLRERERGEVGDRLKTNEERVDARA